MLIPTVYAAEKLVNNTSIYLNDFIHVNGSYPTDGYFNINDDKIEEAVS